MHAGELSVQHGVLVAQGEQFGVLAQVSPHKDGAQTEQPAHEPVQDRQQQHPMRIHDRLKREERRARTLRRVFEPYR